MCCPVVTLTTNHRFSLENRRVSSPVPMTPTSALWSSSLASLPTKFLRDPRDTFGAVPSERLTRYHPCNSKSNCEAQVNWTSALYRDSLYVTTWILLNLSLKRELQISLDLTVTLCGLYRLLAYILASIFTVITWQVILHQQKFKKSSWWRIESLVKLAC